jgi:circadian clock protein KaiC
MENLPAVSVRALPIFEKAPTGIKGVDEIVGGGLPKGHPTLICGSAGCGKTLLAVEFITRGAILYDEPGVLMLFEESAEDVSRNVASLGINLQDLVDRKKLVIDHVHIDRSEIEETGVYDLDGLFVRLGAAIDMVGAKRVALDTIENLFSGFRNETILRNEIRRLFRWLVEKGVTTVVTGERGEATLTRHGLEEYVSDCVILLDNRVVEGIATRLLRVVKYRGSSHGNDEYPFLIDEQGIWVQPVTSVGLDYPVTAEIISSGIPQLDAMLGKQGFYRGSSILISGTAGTGKTSIAANLVDAACSRGERCLYFSYEESPSQITRNMHSIGLNLDQWVDKGLLCFHAIRPTLYGAEMHLLAAQKLVRDFKPQVVVCDPLNNLSSVASMVEVKGMLMRLIDFFKCDGVTALFTSLTGGGENEATTNVGVSSLMDAWLLVRNLENSGERNRALYILKTRGMSSSNQVREFRLTDHGIELVDVYLGAGGILVGTARLAHEAAERADKIKRQQMVEVKKRALERKRILLQSKVDELQAAYEEEMDLLQREIEQEEQMQVMSDEDQENLARARRTV